MTFKALGPVIMPHHLVITPLLANAKKLRDDDVCLSVSLFVSLWPVKFVKSFARWQHLAAGGVYRIDSDTLVH